MQILFFTKKILSLAMLFLLVSFSGIGQTWDWLISAGGQKSDKATTIVVDENGNSYITGYYNEEANFGPFNTGFSFTQSKEVFVAKIDPQGNYLWVKNGLNYYDDRGLGLCLDPMGNVYVTGTCWGGLTFGSLSVYNSTSYTDQIFVIKLDNNGNEIWMKNAGVDQGGSPYNDDHGQDLISDSEGNIYVTGFISNNDNAQVHNANFDAFAIPMQPNDSLAFLGKLSNAGNWLWVTTFEGIWQHRDNALGIDDEDNVYVAGGFTGTRTFGTETITSNNGSEDIYVVKYDKNGNFIYVVSAGDTLDDRADAIVYGNDGHMYVTGEFRGKVGFGNDSINNNGNPTGRDIFVSKLSKDGTWKWASKAGSNKGKDRGCGIAANKQGNIFVTGQFSSTAKFGSFDVSSGGDSVQVFVASIDTLGKWKWVRTGGGPDFDRGASIACDENCNVYVTGYYSETLTFEGLSTTSTNGTKDIFVARMTDACTGYAPPSNPPGGAPAPPFVGFANPNVFTPNGDGANDFLSFGYFENVEGEVSIVNRWGNVVFRTSNLNTPWNGKSIANVPVSEGTYFYHLTIKFPDGTSDQKTGFISLIR